MKKLYLLILTLALGSNLFAQSFSVERDTVKTVMKESLSYLQSYVKNEALSPIQVSWRVFAHNLPQDWIDNGKYAICDNALCYPKSVLGGTIQRTLSIDPGEKMSFIGQISGQTPSLATIGTFYYAVELSEGNTIDTIVFMTSNRATGVDELNTTTPEISLYPNPACNNLNISITNGKNIQYIGVYNLVGKQVGSYTVSNNSVYFNISDQPSGVYFARFYTATGKLITSKKFTKQ